MKKKNKVRERCKDRRVFFISPLLLFSLSLPKLQSHLDSRDLRGLGARGLVDVGLFRSFVLCRRCSYLEEGRGFRERKKKNEEEPNSKRSVPSLPFLLDSYRVCLRLDLCEELAEQALVLLAEVDALCGVLCCVFNFRVRVRRGGVGVRKKKKKRLVALEKMMTLRGQNGRVRKTVFLRRRESIFRRSTCASRGPRVFSPARR